MVLVRHKGGGPNTGTAHIGLAIPAKVPKANPAISSPSTSMADDALNRTLWTAQSG